MAIISMEEADRLTYAGTPASLRVEPTATHNTFPHFKVHGCHMMLHVLVHTANQIRLSNAAQILFSEEPSLGHIYSRMAMGRKDVLRYSMMSLCRKGGKVANVEIMV